MSDVKTTIIREELEVPLAMLIAAADQLIEAGISNEIIATDDDDDCVTLSIEYEKEQREVIHEIRDMIADYEEQDEDEQEDDD